MSDAHTDVFDAWSDKATKTLTIIADYQRKVITRQHVKGCVGKIVADFGCGQGQIAKFVAPTALHYYALDLLPEQIQAAKKECTGDNITFIQTDCSKRQPLIKTASVDRVISSEVFEHMDHYDDYISEISRVLKPGGVLTLSTPSLSLYCYPSYFVWAFFKHPVSLRKRLHPFRNWEESVKYHPSIRLSDLKKLLSRHGIDVIKHKNVTAFCEQHYVKCISAWFERLTGRALPGLNLWMEIHERLVGLIPILGYRHSITAVRR